MEQLIISSTPTLPAAASAAADRPASTVSVGSRTPAARTFLNGSTQQPAQAQRSAASLSSRNIPGRSDADDINSDRGLPPDVWWQAEEGAPKTAIGATANAGRRAGAGMGAAPAPPILTNASIELLFDMHEAIATLTGGGLKGVSKQKGFTFDMCASVPAHLWADPF